MALSFDEEREANIRRNKELLLLLEINMSNVVPARAKPPPKVKTKKRKTPPPSEDAAEENVEPEGKPNKAARIESPELTGLRRSSRVAASGRIVDYAGDGDRLNNHKIPKLVTEAARRGVMQTEARVADKRTQDP